MKERAHVKIIKILSKPIFNWFFINPISRILVSFLTKIEFYSKVDHKRAALIKNIRKEIIRKSVVLNGPFKNLKYINLNTSDGKFIHGNIVPKLLGTYENELHAFILGLELENYSDLLVIGSAEGYYSIGLQLKHRFARNISFDIDRKAKNKFWELAKANKVQDQVEFMDYCTPEFLAQYRFESKGLIICDCEGFERDLFTCQNIENLKNCDLIIELHDFVKNVSIPLIDMFKTSHDLQFQNVLAPAHKMRILNSSYLTEYPIDVQFELISEGRPNQEWMLLKSKRNANK